MDSIISMAMTTDRSDRTEFNVYRASFYVNRRNNTVRVHTYYRNTQDSVFELLIDRNSKTATIYSTYSPLTLWTLTNYLQAAGLTINSRQEENAS